MYPALKILQILNDRKLCIFTVRLKSDKKYFEEICSVVDRDLFSFEHFLKRNDVDRKKIVITKNPQSPSLRRNDPRGNDIQLTDIKHYNK